MPKTPKPTINPATLTNIPSDDPRSSPTIDSQQGSPASPDPSRPEEDGRHGGDVPSGVPAGSGDKVGQRQSISSDVPSGEQEAADERTPHQIWEAKKAFMEGNGYPFNEEEPAQDEVKPEKGKKADDKPGEGKPGKAGKPEDRLPARRKPALEPEEVERIASRVASETLDRRTPPKPEAAPAPQPSAKIPDGLELSEEDQEELEVIRKMAEINPQAKDLPDKMLKFWKDEQEYVLKWEKDNPGQEFDPQSSEHRPFYAKEPAVSRRDYKIAERKIIEDSVRKTVEDDVNKRITPELERIQARELYRERAPEIHAETGKGVINFVAASDEELAKLMEEEDGGKALNAEIAKKMQEQDPLAWGVINREAQILEAKLNELGKLSKLGRYYKARDDYSIEIEGERVYVHSEIRDTAAKMEAEILSRPKAQQTWEGKKFLTQNQFRTMLSQIDSKPVSKEQKERERDDVFDNYWFLEPEDIANGIVQQHSNRAKNLIKKLRSYMKSSGTNGKPSASPSPQSTATRKPAIPQPDEDDTPPPSTSSQADTLANQNAGKSGNKTTEQIVRENW